MRLHMRLALRAIRALVNFVVRSCAPGEVVWFHSYTLKPRPTASGVLSEKSGGFRFGYGRTEREAMSTGLTFDIALTREMLEKARESLDFCMEQQDHQYRAAQEDIVRADRVARFHQLMDDLGEYQ
jgi:hypothetical protein